MSFNKYFNMKFDNLVNSLLSETIAYEGPIGIKDSNGNDIYLDNIVSFTTSNGSETGKVIDCTPGKVLISANGRNIAMDSSSVIKQ
jgi:hypothetical protein